MTVHSIEGFLAFTARRAAEDVLRARHRPSEAACTWCYLGMTPEELETCNSTDLILIHERWLRAEAKR